MAKINNGHFGSYQGKIGAVTGRKRLGKFYISQSITHNGSRTSLQLRAREVLTVASAFAGKLAKVVNETYAKRAGDGKTALNVFTGEVARNAVIAEMQPNGTWVAEVQVDKVVLAKGNVPGITNIRTTVSGGAMKFTWDGNMNADGALDSDMVNIVAVNRDNDQVIFLKNDKEVKRSKGEVSFAYPKSWADAEAVVYIYLKSAEAGKFSDSIYVGSIVLSE